MARIGPITTTSATERTEEPSGAAVEASIRWAVSVENAAVARFSVSDRPSGTVRDCYQLLGPHHHLSSLTDRRVERARSLFRQHDAPEAQLEPRMYDDRLTLDVELPATDADTHVAIAAAVLEDVYNTAPGEVVRIERSTVELDRDGASETTAICDECATSAPVRFMLRGYGDLYYAAVDKDDAVSPNEFDFVFTGEGRWVCAGCLPPDRLPE